jgi:hypothetical protein
MQTETRNDAVAAPFGPTSQETSHAQRTRLAGALLALTGVGILMSIITNEALYPAARHYNTFTNTISDLGGTSPPNSYMVQPNRAIFVATMAVSSILVLFSTYLLWPSVARTSDLDRPVWCSARLSRGSRCSPRQRSLRGTRGSRWPASLAGSITAITSRKVLHAPVTYFAVALGVIALVATFAGLEAFEGRRTAGLDRAGRRRAMDRISGPDVAGGVRHSLDEPRRRAVHALDVDEELSLRRARMRHRSLDGTASTLEIVVGRGGGSAGEERAVRSEQLGTDGEHVAKPIAGGTEEFL